MLTSFTTDAKRASDTDRPASISQSGCYTGVFRQVYTYQSAGGAQMVSFNFADQQSGQTCFTDLCIMKKNGEAAFGMDILNAILLCMGVQKADAVQGKARNRRGEKIDALRITAMENRPVGIVLQKEWDTYQDQNGDLKETYRMIIAKPFDPQTRRTASEITEGREPKILEQFVKNLKDRDRRTNIAQSAPAAPVAASAAAAPAVGAAPQPPLDSYDDCPF